MIDLMDGHGGLGGSYAPEAYTGHIPGAFSGQTNGMAYRRLAHEWSSQERPLLLLPRHSTARPGTSTTDSLASRAINGWPRILQMTSISVAFLAAIFASAHILSAAWGLTVGFLGLTLLFFGNFAAYRRGDAARLVGPTIAVIGVWGSFVIAIAIGVNALLGG